MTNTMIDPLTLEHPEALHPQLVDSAELAPSETIARAEALLERAEVLTRLLAEDDGYEPAELDFELPCRFKLSVVIPVYNEERTIARVLARVKALPLDTEIVVVNDCSTDGTRELLAAHPDLRILVITMSADDDAVVAAMRAGARGYVVKGAGRTDLLQAVGTVAAGGAVFSPAIAERLGSFFSGLAAQPGRELFPQLSEREREVLDLVARGYDNRRIARALFLSDKTVRNNVSTILTKLGAADRAEAVLRARRAGLGEEPSVGGDV